MSFNKRIDGIFYKLIESKGQFFIELVNEKGERVDGWAISFDSEEQAWKAVAIARISFDQGYKYGQETK